MKTLKQIIIAVLLFTGTCINAQERQDTAWRWQWAKTGGSLYWNAGNSHEQIVRNIFYDTPTKTITIAGTMAAGEAHYDGQLLPPNFVVNRNTISVNGFVMQLDCEGNMRWYYPFGSESGDNTNETGKDEENNTYTTVICGFGNVLNLNNDTVIATNNPAFNDRRADFYFKLNGEGELQWVKNFCDSSQWYMLGHTRESIATLNLPFSIFTENNGISHHLIDMEPITRAQAGYSSFFNGVLIIDSTMAANNQWWVFRCDADGNYLDFAPLPVKKLGNSDKLNNGNYHLNFLLDTISSQYYLYGNIGNAAFTSTCGIINGDTIPTGSGYIAAFDMQGNHLWHKIYYDYELPSGHNFYQVGSLDFDNNGNLYFSIPKLADFALDEDGLIIYVNYIHTLVKMSPEGNVIWEFDFPEKFIDNTYGIKVIDDRVFTFALRQELIDMSYYRYDSYLFTWDTDGNFIDSTFLYSTNSGSALNNFHTTAQDNNGNLLVGGNMYSTVNFSDTVTMSNIGEHDFFIAKYGRYDCNYVKPPTDGIYTPQKLDVTIYPNPASDILKIENGEYQINSVKITDLAGRLLFVKFSYINSVNVSKFPKGVYLLKIQTDKGLIVKRFVKI